MTKELLQQALDALIRRSFLGNGDFPGNSEGNRIAQKAVSDIRQALAQQEQPASVDAYVGAREDAAIWKKRALEAEELNRKFIAEVNGPTYFGEPARPAQKPVASIVPCFTPSGKRVALNTQYQDLPIGTILYTAPPTRPAMSDDRLNEIIHWQPLPQPPEAA